MPKRAIGHSIVLSLPSVRLLSSETEAVGHIGAIDSLVVPKWLLSSCSDGNDCIELQIGHMLEPIADCSIDV
jgi:hypothetical protein